MSDSLQPHGLYSSWNSPGQNTGVGSFSLLQRIFPTQGSNPGLPHCKRILYQLSHQGSPRILEWVAYAFSRGSSQPSNWTGVSCIAGGFFTSWATREARGSVVKKLLAGAGVQENTGLIPGSGRSPGGGYGSPLRCSCLENPIDRRAWWATVCGVAKSQKWLSDWSCTFNIHLWTLILKSLMVKWPNSRDRYEMKCYFCLGTSPSLS